MILPVLKLTDTLGVLGKTLDDSRRSVGNYKSKLEPLIFMRIKVKGRQYARPFYLNMALCGYDPLMMIDVTSGTRYTERDIYELTHKMR